MNREERIELFKRDLAALVPERDAMVIFNLAHDEDTFIQYSHVQAGDPLLCEVSNRSEGWNAHSLDARQVEALRALGYEIPSPHHQANPRKESAGDPAALAAETEQIFRNVFGVPEDYEVESSGVLW